MNKRVYQRYNEQELRSLVAESDSFTDVCRKLNKKPVGGTITNMNLMCRRLNIDTSHMPGQGWKKGKPDIKRKSPDQVLVVGSPTDHRVEASKLRRALIGSGVSYKCNCCGIIEWNNQPLVLEIDHINEQYWNNTKENLQFLCPNCHAQKTKKAQVTQLV